MGDFREIVDLVLQSLNPANQSLFRFEYQHIIEESSKLWRGEGIAHIYENCVREREPSGGCLKHSFFLRGSPLKFVCNLQERLYGARHAFLSRALSKEDAVRLSNPGRARKLGEIPSSSAQQKREMKSAAAEFYSTLEAVRDAERRPGGADVDLAFAGPGGRAAATDSSR